MELREIKEANPGFFHGFAELLGDENYRVVREGKRWFLLLDTRYTKPTYLVDPKTLELTYSHDRSAD